MTWTPVPASHHNTYHGTIPAGLLAGRGLPYDHSCFESADEHGD
ncbi:MAG: hypothetical protein ACREAA_18085 [Candidatus Polarisedimenticolia bacterium]